MKIDTQNWKEFRLGKLYDSKTGKSEGTGLFNIVNSVAYHGKDITETDSFDSINYVTRSKFNNGIKCRVLKKDEYVINPKGAISFGAENADFFYQKEEYITGNKMYYIDTSMLSEYVCNFLKSVLQATFTESYSFSDGMIPARIYDEIIKLPATPSGEPDWQYMEDYMRQIEARVCDSLTKLESAKGKGRVKVDTGKWGEFCIGNLFEFSLPKGDLQTKCVEDGDTMLITPSNFNNGLFKRIANDSSSTLYDAGCITVDMFGQHL